VQGRRVDPRRQQAHVVEGLLDVSSDLLEERRQRRGAVVGGPAGELQGNPERDQPLLHAVVQLVLDAAALRIGGGDQPRARRAKRSDVEVQVVEPPIVHR
jgi:hypothetical protein